MTTLPRTAAPDATTTWAVHRAPLPARLDDPQAWAVLGAAAVGRAVDVAVFGHDDLAVTADESLAFLSTQTYSTRMLLVAVPAGVPGRPRADDVVGSATLSLPKEGSTRSAFLTVRVHPALRRSGVGTALLDAAERVAAEHGRTSLIAETDHVGEPPADAAHLIPPTGSGRISPDDAGARFALHRGYALEQAERYSVLDLPVDPDLVTRLRTDAAAHAGADYRVVWWTDHAPDRWVDDVAHLSTRMSTDVPTAELDVEEEPWDADRVRTAEASIAAAGHGHLMVTAEHVPTGRLVAYTMVEVPHAKPAVVFQEDTLVLSEHRGRRLGMLVKTAALELLREQRPQARRVHTWNAEENAHMLAINVALGFRPVGVAGMWQRRTA